MTEGAALTDLFGVSSFEENSNQKTGNIDGFQVALALAKPFLSPTGVKGSGKRHVCRTPFFCVLRTSIFVLFPKDD